jgi:L-histidine N-alpha-methyltransferase
VRSLAPGEAFAADVIRDLRRVPKQLQSRYLYDDLGSSLFDAICRLPWYSITRAEAGLLRQYAPIVAGELARSAGGALSVIELGVGNGEKLATILDALPRAASVAVHLIDISPAALSATAARVSGFAGVSVLEYQGTYQEGLDDAVRRIERPARALALFLGSNIGNFDGPAAGELLASIRRALRPGDLLLLGTDLVKAESELVLAYDDPLGVTAAFNKNLLVRINRELEADFDPTTFEHRAIWNPPQRRVEMHLVSRLSQTAHIAATSTTIAFDAGETIWTESSYKYTQAEIAALCAGAGFRPHTVWVDGEAQYALILSEAR